MIPTGTGLAVFLLGWWLLRRGDLMALLCAMLALGLMEASAAVVLPLLSGSSIPPARVMLAFLCMAGLIRINRQASLGSEAMIANGWFSIFCIYGLISAFVLPRLFAGQIDVVPLRPAGLRHYLDAFPLGFTSQNVTTGIYLIGTGLTALGAYVATRCSRDLTPLIMTAALVTLANAVTGLMGVALIGTPWDLVVDFVRSGSYSQLDQATQSFVRVSGFMAEPSNYARFGIVWMIFCCELWLRHLRPGWTGSAALLMAIVLVLSTSSTAYVGLAGYGALLALRFLLLPSYLRMDKIGLLALVGTTGLIAMLALVLISEPVAREFEAMLRQMTVDKADSLSGQQRAFWAKQGFDAFVASFGLGIGAGSFRSSSLATAIIGSMGVIGVISFLAYVAMMFRRAILLADAPEGMSERLALSAAAAWAAVAGLIPSMLIQGSPDPGMEFAALAGLSLALRKPALAPLAAANSLPSRWGDAMVRAPEAPQSGGWRHSTR